MGYRQVVIVVKLEKCEFKISHHEEITYLNLIVHLVIMDI